jgi:hypothetical protein
MRTKYVREYERRTKELCKDYNKRVGTLVKVRDREVHNLLNNLISKVIKVSPIKLIKTSKSKYRFCNILSKRSSKLLSRFYSQRFNHISDEFRRNLHTEDFMFQYKKNNARRDCEKFRTNL